jgi:hypothetical protein
MKASVVATAVGPICPVAKGPPDWIQAESRLCDTSEDVGGVAVVFWVAEGAKVLSIVAGGTVVERNGVGARVPIASAGDEVPGSAEFGLGDVGEEMLDSVRESAS